MKRFLTLTVFLLLTLFVFVQEGYCLTNPVGYTETETPDGDDHPWGGDEITTPPNPVPTNGGKTDYYTSFSTGVSAIDYPIYFFDIIKFKFHNWFDSKPTLKRNNLELKESSNTTRVTAKSLNLKR